MPRIRSIKPDFWSDEKLAGLDPLDRLVFLGLISMADDAGRLIDNLKSIDGQLFPVTDHSSRESLETLARLSRISRYTVASGQKVIQVVNWHHQRIAHPSTHVLPPQEDMDTLARSSREAHESLARIARGSHELLVPDLGSRRKEVGDKEIGNKEVVSRERARDHEPRANRAEQTAPRLSQSDSTATAKAKPERSAPPGHSADMLRRGSAAYDTIARKARSFGLITELTAGDYELLDFRTRAGFAAVGGWRGLREVKGSEEPWDRKRFAEAYAAATIPGGVATDPVAAEGA